MVGTEGLEPPTSTTSMWRSSQLSYVPFVGICAYKSRFAAKTEKASTCCYIPPLKFSKQAFLKFD